MQTDIQAKDVLRCSDPGMTNLQENLAQAKLTTKRLEEETIPQQRYQELQMQLRDINTSKSEDFNKYERAEERAEKIKVKLEIVMRQMDTLSSLYIDVLACRSLAKNYALFLLESYLQLKIKVVRAGKPTKLKTVEDFINCCKHHGVKFQRLLYEFYLHNFVLEEEMEKNPNPFVGDIQFQAFISFVVNQLKSFKAHNTFQR